MNNKINLTNNETIDIEAAKEEVGEYQQVIGANLHSMHIDSDSYLILGNKIEQIEIKKPTE